MAEDIAAVERRIELALKASTPTAFGRRLKEVREKQGVSVRNLAERARLSKTSIVNLEQGKGCRPVTILKVCAALGLHIERFLPDDNQPKAQDAVVHRLEDDRWFDLNGFANGPLGGLERPLEQQELQSFHQEGVGAQMLMFKSRFPDSDFIPGIIELTQPTERRSHPGQEFIYVLEGHLVVEVGDQKYELQPRESICFDPNIEHAYRPANPPIKVSFFCFRLNVGI